MEQVDKICNEDAEREILGIILKDNNKVTPIKTLISQDDFFGKPHRHIYSTIVRMVDEGKIADIVTVSEDLEFNNILELCGGRGYINDLLMNVISAANYKGYCNIIINYAKKRKLSNLCTNSVDKLLNNIDVDEVASDLRLGIEEVLINKSSDNLNHIASGVAEVFEQVEKVLTSENKILGLPTPFPTLNKITSGLCKGRLYILGARPKVGKTSLMMNIARTISVNYNVAVASLEMGLSEYTQREVFDKCNINQEMIANGMVSDDVYSKILNAGKELERLKLYIIDDCKATLSTIENGIINCIAKNGSCDLVCVDYLQLMASDDKKKRDDYDIVTYNSKGLKRLARKYKVPMLVLCQLSRALELRADKRPMLSDLRDSGAIEQDADVVMFLYREEVHTYTPNKGHTDLIIAANRQGRTGIVPLLFTASNTKFKERVF